MTNVKVAVVTGGNRGIGFAVVKNLCKKFNGHVYLTSRNEQSAKESAERLKKMGIDCRYHQLDIDDIESVNRLAQFLKHEYGRLDVLVNNAGVICSPDSSIPLKSQLKNTVNINYFGTLNLCNALFELLQPGARVVNVTSDWGCIYYVKNAHLKQKLLDSDLTVEKISSIMNEYVSIAEQNSYQNDIYEAYMISKNGLNALTRIQQSTFDSSRPDAGIIVSAVHPGEVTTDMNKDYGTILPDEGSETIVYLALSNESPNIPKGKFWYLKRVLDWCDPNLDVSVFH